MKTTIKTLLALALVLGCGKTVIDQTDNYAALVESAGYEDEVASANKGDGPAGGALGKLELPKSANCPTAESELEGHTEGENENPETPPETDPGNENTETETGTETEAGTGTETGTETEAGTETEPEVSDDPCADALANSPWSGFAPVYDLEAAHVEFPDGLRAPEDYPRPRIQDFRMGGSEYWQKWAGGKGPLFGYGSDQQGSTEMGRRCMAAAALRFELLLIDPPEAMVELKANSNWGGSFFNWVDDFSHEDSWGSASAGRLWAWRTGLIKFISQTATDGSCYLPTRTMMESLAQDCLETAERSDGEIQGCRN
jgi:hypothetical protein